jgi:hypothetical protein
MSDKNPSAKPSWAKHTCTLGCRRRRGLLHRRPGVSNPVNPTVVNGTATFNQAGKVLTVTNSNGAIINWDNLLDQGR